jgi:hypothetical protein
MKHLTTHYGDNNGRLAKIYLLDEQKDAKEVNHVYVDTAQQAEDIAEDFVLEA